ncbi:FecR domain-containing protein [Verrucomicrobiales bacterium]|nr:FecR domain-containing protein [Verrucomicrobiales bacterium]
MKSPNELMIRYFDGQLSDEELRELQGALMSEPELCEEFVASAEIHGRLQEELAGGNLVSFPKVSRQRRRLPAIVGVAATLAILAAGWWLAGINSGSTTAGDCIELAVARVIHEENGRWGLERNRVAEIGEWLMPGTYHLETGEVIMALDVGGTARIEGPSVFEIIDDKLIRLESGDLQARFEESGQGFTVLTPEGKIVDLGTEFRIEVSNGESTVQVVKGRVRATAGIEVRELVEKQSVAMSSGAMKAFSSETANPIVDEFENQASVVFYHWSFEETEGDHFSASGSDRAAEYGLKPGLPGRVPDRIEGARGGQALRFSGTGEFLESSYRGVSGSRPRTVAAWVRIPRDAGPKEAYGWAGWGLQKSRGRNLKSRKWQVSWNPQVKPWRWKQPLSPGSVAGAIRTEFGPGWVNGTRDLRDGTWHHVVSIFIGGEDADVATHIRHYVDGRLEYASGFQHAKVETSTGEESHPLAVGNHLTSAKSIKKFSAENEKIPNPYFSGFRGDLDELYIFEGVLTPVQVWRLYKENLPPEPQMISPSFGKIGS